MLLFCAFQLDANALEVTEGAAEGARPRTCASIGSDVISLGEVRPGGAVILHRFFIDMSSLDNQTKRLE